MQCVSGVHMHAYTGSVSLGMGQFEQTLTDLCSSGDFCLGLCNLCPALTAPGGCSVTSWDAIWPLNHAPVADLRFPQMSADYETELEPWEIPIEGILGSRGSCRLACTLSVSLFIISLATVVLKMTLSVTPSSPLDVLRLIATQAGSLFAAETQLSLCAHDQNACIFSSLCGQGLHHVL
jgi:hypothetical protein